MSIVSIEGITIPPHMIEQSALIGNVVGLKVIARSNDDVKILEQIRSSINGHDSYHWSMSDDKGAIWNGTAKIKANEFYEPENDPEHIIAKFILNGNIIDKTKQ